MNQNMPKPQTKKSATLWIGDLEPEVDEKYLYSVFAINHVVKSIKLYKDKLTNGRVNYAFVEFESIDVAEKVLNSFNGNPKPGYAKPFKINWGTPKTKRDNNSAAKFTNPQIGAKFTNPQMNPNFFKTIQNQFYSPYFLPQQNNILSETPQIPMIPLNHPMLFPNTFHDKAVALPEKKSIANKNTIYVGDIDDKVEIADLLSFFKNKYPSVSNVKLVKDAVTKKKKGYGFVTFGDQNEADRAISEMNGTILMGKKIKTNKSFTKNSLKTHQNEINNKALFYPTMMVPKMIPEGYVPMINPMVIDKMMTPQNGKNILNKKKKKKKK